MKLMIQLIAQKRFDAESGDHTRLTWGPGSNEPPPKSEADTRITTYAHTDFGSVTLLFNWRKYKPSATYFNGP